LFRALGIPARLVITANAQWMAEYRDNPLVMPRGHVFIEAFLEDRWYLVDSTYRLLFKNYRPANPYYPRGEFFFDRCQDFWEIEIYQVEDMENRFKDFALSAEPPTVAASLYPSTGI